MNFGLLLTILRVTHSVLPSLVTALEGHGGNVVGTSLQTGEALLTAVQAKASPDSMQAAASAVMSTAQAAGLSAEDQSNVSAVAATLSSYAPVVSALVTAGMPDHASAVTQAVGILQAVALGLTSQVVTAQPVAAEPAAS